jgi:hypothetical protein
LPYEKETARFASHLLAAPQAELNGLAIVLNIQSQGRRSLRVKILDLKRG